MSDLVCVRHNGVEFVLDTKNKKEYLTITGYSKLTGVNNATIRQRCRRKIKKQMLDKAAVKTPIAAKPLCWSDAMRSIQLDTGRGVFKTLLIPMEDIAIWIKKDRPNIAENLSILIEDLKRCNE